VVFGKLGSGSYIGELTITEGAPRLTSAWTMCNTHFFTLRREDLKQVIGTHDNRVFSEKIAYLKSFSIFNRLSSTKLKNLIP